MDGVSSATPPPLTWRQTIGGLVEAGDVERARNANEEIYDIARWRIGTAVFLAHRMEIFDAVVPHPTLHPRFLRERFPRMRANIERARARAVDVAARRAGNVMQKR